LTKAVSNSGSIKLEGTKNWITNAAEAEATVAFVKAANAEKRHHVSSYIVPLATKGVKIGKKEDKLGIRGSSTCSITFDNCLIPPDSMLGKDFFIRIQDRYYTLSEAWSGAWLPRAPLGPIFMTGLPER